MSKTKLFLQVVEDVQALADSLQELAVAMKTNEPEPQVETPEPTMETKSEVKNKLISDSVTGSPKTGTHGVGLVFSIITVSGTIAFITRKKY